MADNSASKLELLLREHDLRTQSLRDELAQRTEGERLYDECLLNHLRKGKKFKIALRKANQKFPTEALNLLPDQIEDVEARYHYLLEMEEIDEMRRQLEESDRRIAALDAEIDRLRQEPQLPDPGLAEKPESK